MNVETEVATTFIPKDFRSWLQKEFTNRCKKNPRFSLRAFAGLLKTDSSSLSQILLGKRKVSRAWAEKICDRLGAKPAVREQILSNYGFAKGKDEVKIQDYQQLTLDIFTVISEWYHYAILELTFTESFKSDPAWIARMLSITPTEASLAIERLQRLELIEVGGGRLRKTETFITNFSDGVTAPALKALQRQILEKAIDAIDNVPGEEKDITSMTMAIDVEKLPEARKRIKEFRRRLCDFLEKGKRVQVYHLGVQLYPVSKLSKKFKE